MSAQLQPDTFAARFVAEFAGQDVRGVAVPRRKAGKVLAGVPSRMIPTRTIERRPFVPVTELLMLCCCLDDHEVGASPHRVTADQVALAWLAAGHERWLQRVARREVAKRIVSAAYGASR